MKNIKIVLDTSIFVNPDARFVFGSSPEEALDNFLDKIKDNKNTTFYIPPSVYEELSKFLKKQPCSKKNALLIKQPPSSYTSSIPALFMYEFIGEMRTRLNKGLRLAEKYTRKALKMPLTDDKRKEEEIIKPLRQEYRTALREGVLDSKEDFDLVLLSKELNARLATADFGLIKWAQKIGITCITAQELNELCQETK